MLTAVNVTKNYGLKIALKDVNLTLENGHIFGLLGTNGAGKSTLLRILSGILKPDGGKALLDGVPVYETSFVKESVCYLSDDPAFLTNATLAEMGRMQRAYYLTHDPQKLQALCQRFNLPMDERISGFSKGTQKRAQICLGLARNPDALLCDETFDGLDPVMRETFKKVIRQETCDRGLITVLAGHNQQEMEDICDTVGFLHQGRLVRTGDLDTLLENVHKVQLVPTQEATEEDFAPLRPLRVQRQGRLWVLTLRGGRQQTRQALAPFAPVFEEFLPLSLEEVFILEMEEHGYGQ